eukprot:6191359-Pleurochrysis_carterae.AAC.6
MAPVNLSNALWSVWCVRAFVASSHHPFVAPRNAAGHSGIDQREGAGVRTKEPSALLKTQITHDQADQK